MRQSILVQASWLIGVAVFAAGCKDRGAEYFQQQEAQRQAEQQGETGTAEEETPEPVEVNLQELAQPEEEIDLDIFPPPKLVGIRELTQKYEDDSPRISRSVKYFSDDSTVNHGPYKEWHPNGQLYVEGEYVDGKREGRWTFYHPNGKKAKVGSYKDGKPNGKYTCWRPDGTKEREAEYKMSLRHGQWTYFDKTGEKRVRQEEFADGKPNGTFIEWNEDGVKIAEQHFLDGRRDGPQTVWYDNGQMKMRVEFKDNVRHGKTIQWTEDGAKLGEVVYENGVPVKTQVAEDGSGE